MNISNTLVLCISTDCYLFIFFKKKRWFKQMCVESFCDVNIFELNAFLVLCIISLYKKMLGLIFKNNITTPNYKNKCFAVAIQFCRYLYLFSFHIYFLFISSVRFVGFKIMVSSAREVSSLS